MSRWLLVPAGVAAAFIVIIALAARGCLDWGSDGDPNWGKFSGRPNVDLLDDGRKLQLREAFEYTDQDKKVWNAPKDSIVDGASIPQLFWSIAGGPLEGKYRNASICHDVECDRKTEPWEAVHLMFYNACRCGGVREKQAKILYIAVYLFGPRWVIRIVKESHTQIGPDGKPRTVEVEVQRKEQLYGTKPTESDVEEIQNYVNEKNPSLDDLREHFQSKQPINRFPADEVVPKPRA